MDQPAVSMSSALAGGLFTTSAFWQALILMFKFVDLINIYVCEKKKKKKIYIRVCVYTHIYTRLYMFINSVQVQLLSCVRLFAPHGLQHGRPPCP